MSEELKELETRLRGVEVSVAKLCTKFDDNVRVQTALLTKHDLELYGNGREGVKIQLDRLEVAAKKKGKLLWVVIGGVVGLIVKLFYEAISHHLG